MRRHFDIREGARTLRKRAPRLATSSSSDKNHWGLLGCGFLTLMASAYFDGMKGPLLPVFAEQLSLTYGRASWFLTGANLGALLASLFLNRALARFGEKKTFLAALLLAVATSFASLTVKTFGTMLVFGAMLGAVVTLLSTMCTLLILQGGAARYRGNIYSGGQVLVGISFLLFPLWLKAALGQGMPWNWLVAPAAAYFLILGVLAWRAIPVPEMITGTPEILPPVTRTHLLVIFLFGAYVAGESMAFAWLVAFARDVLARNDAEANAMLVRFFTWFAGSRFVISLGLRSRWEALAIYGCLGLGAGAAVLGMLGFSTAFPAVGLIGPFFPLMLTHASRLFPREWKRVTVWVFLYIQLFMALTHVLVGYLAERFGLRVTYWLMPFFFAITMALFTVFQRRIKQRAI